MRAAGILAFVVALAVLPFLVAGEPDAGEEAFAGADGRAAAVVEERYEPWSAPLWEPGSETASGLFALQAAAGGAVLGYVAGAYRGRRRRGRADA